MKPRSYALRMGILRDIDREQRRRKAKLARENKPKPAMATVAGTTHRLKWLDRHAGYRMGCSCGWTDTTSRSSEDAAVRAANAHVQGVQRDASQEAAAARRAVRKAAWEAKTPEQRRSRVILLAVCSVVLVAVGGTGIGLLVNHVAHPGSYADGVHWASSTSDNPFGYVPGCQRMYMSSSGKVDGTQAANEPDDNYSLWRAGCKSVLGTSSP
jgi:hypothetical protein